METLLHHHDEPFGDSSALPTYLVAREARAPRDGGAQRRRRRRDVRRLRPLPAPRCWPSALPGPAARARCARRRALLPDGRHVLRHAARALRRFARKAALPLDERIFAWSGFFDLPALARAGRRRRRGPRPRALVLPRRARRACSGASLLSRLLYLNARTYLLDDLLPKMDRMTMAHGLEARSPLLDRDARSSTWRSLPDALQAARRPRQDRAQGGGRGAAAAEILRAAQARLRRAARRLVPRRAAADGRGHAARPARGWAARLRLAGVRALFDEHAAGRADRGHQLWTLLTLELWLRKHEFD